MCIRCDHTGVFKDGLCFSCYWRYGKDTVKKRKTIKKQTSFIKKYGKSLVEIAKEYGVSLPTVSRNDKAGLPLGHKKRRGGNQGKGTTKLMDYLTMKKEENELHTNKRDVAGRMDLQAQQS